MAYYTSGDVEACAHANQTTSTVEASCTVDGSITVTCNDCGVVVSTDTIEATGHKYVDGFCTVCDEKEPLEATATLVFDADKANRTEFSTSKQVWSQNGIVFTNNKASSTTNVADYGNPVRLYASSSITVEMNDGSKIVKIEFVCDDYKDNYPTDLATSIGANATVSGTTVTVELDSVENYTVTLGAQVRLDSLNVYYEVNEAQAECTHVNTTTDTTPATCTTAGRIVVTCANEECGKIISEETIEALGHNFVNGVCTRSECGYLDGTNVPAGDIVGNSSTLDFSDVANRLQYDSTMQIWGQNGVGLVNNKASSTTAVADAYNPVKLYKDSSVTISSAKEIVKIVFVCNTTDYASALATSIGSAAVVDGKNVTVVLADPATSYTISMSAQVRLDSLTVYYEPAISSASVTLGTNLAMNYTVAVPTGYDVNGMKMVFTMNGVETVVDTYVTDAAGNAVFTFNRLAPQCMGDSIDAVLYIGDNEFDSYEGYSVKAYAEQLLAVYGVEESENYNADVVKLVVDMLNYGAAAQAYRGYKTDALVNAGITAAGSDVAPTDADNKLTATNKGNRNDYADYGITSAGVRFDYINKVYVKFAAPSLENVTVLVNGVAAEVATTNGGYVVYSDAINALEFDEVVTFELQVGGETIQALTYSVNTYAFNKANTESEVADLALALYRYGKSAAAYAANN